MPMPWSASPNCSTRSVCVLQPTLTLTQSCFEVMAGLSNPVLPLVPDFIPFGPVVAVKHTFKQLRELATSLVKIRESALTEQADPNSKIFVDILLQASEKV